MKFKSLEGVIQFFDGAGNVHSPNADGHFVTDHPQTAGEMLRAGFEKVEEFVSGLVNEVEEVVCRLLHRDNGNEVGTIPATPKTGDTVHDGEGTEVQVLSVSEDGKTAVIGPIVQETTQSKGEEEQHSDKEGPKEPSAAELGSEIRKGEDGPLIDLSKDRPDTVNSQSADGKDLLKHDHEDKGESKGEEHRQTVTGDKGDSKGDQEQK